MHGGTTEEDIMKCLHHAIEVSKKNKRKNAKFGTVLFFDEANTTEAIGLIKEIMCDHTCNGKPLPDTSGLHLIAACNPYRKYAIIFHCHCVTLSSSILKLGKILIQSYNISLSLPLVFSPSILPSIMGS